VSASAGVLGRVLGGFSQFFELTLTDSAGGLDQFEVEASDGGVRVTGTSATTLCRGAYHYLRHCCNRQLSWSSGPIVLSGVLPDCLLIRVSTPCRYRFYLSVCTYGYSMPWWDWARWEQELDWMAMHGINMPLLLAGQEIVWRNVFLEMGLTEEQLAAHFCGPAFLPWQRLGNVNGHQGPLPGSWMESQAVLQRLILDRARELQMVPVGPGFSGFVPTALPKIRSDTVLYSAEPWAGFEKTRYIDPRSGAFRDVGRRFMEEYRRLYGPIGHFLCEAFAEQVPQLAPETELDDLREIGRATWAVLADFEPEATWVMQGWPFYFAQEYWKPEKAAALLDAVPSGRALVLDLATEEFETWRQQPAMREKGWMFNVVHNYGQNTHLHGDLQGFIDRWFAAINDPGRGLLEGAGVSPEGIDQNPVVYELLTDLMWSAGPFALDDWIRSYARSRYDRMSASAEEAWGILHRTVYTSRPPNPRYTWRFRPGDQPLVPSVNSTRLRVALEKLLVDADELRDSSAYRRDLVDVAKTWLGGLADEFLDSGNSAQFLASLEDLDRLLTTHPEYRLSTWLAAARSCSSTPDEAILFECNARTLITYWGGPFLFDYATREWAGLVLDFHRERWRLWFDHQQGLSPPPDFDQWERAWANFQTAPLESEPRDEIKLARELLAKYRSRSPLSESTVTRLEPCRADSGVLEVDLVEMRELQAVCCSPIFGQGCRAHYSVSTSSDGEVWESAGVSGAAVTSRGTRCRLAGRPTRFLRIAIEVVNGSPEQQFQLTLFEPVSSSSKA